MARPTKLYRWEKQPDGTTKKTFTGKWRIRWYDHEGKVQSEVFAQEKSAKAALRAREVERDQIRSGQVAPKKEAPLFGEFAERWIETYPKSAGNRKGTEKGKRMDLKAHLMPAFKDLRLTEIRGQAVDEFFASLRRPNPERKKQKKALAEKTIKNIRGTLAKMLRTACDWGELDALPTLPRVKVPEQKFDFLTYEEEAAVLAACTDAEQRTLILFALKTGLRAGEQRALEWGDLDFHANKIIVARSMDSDNEVGPTKSGKERKVTITPQLAAALKAHRHLRGRLVFCRPDGSPLSLDQLHERIWKACRRAGIREITWHSLRHTYASHLAMANVPLKKIQELLGHSTLAMTMRYAHLMPSDDLDVAAALDRTHTRHSGEAKAKTAEGKDFLVSPEGIETGSTGAK